MKRKKTAHIYRYTAVFEPAAEGGFTVTVPVLPGCVSEGDTFEEARRNIHEAIELYVETFMDQKNAPRLPNDLSVVAPIEVTIPS